MRENKFYRLSLSLFLIEVLSLDEATRSEVVVVPLLLLPERGCSSQLLQLLATARHGAVPEAAAHVFELLVAGQIAEVDLRHVTRCLERVFAI